LARVIRSVELTVLATDKRRTVNLNEVFLIGALPPPATPRSHGLPSGAYQIDVDETVAESMRSGPTLMPGTARKARKTKPRANVPSASLRFEDQGLVAQDVAGAAAVLIAGARGRNAMLRRVLDKAKAWFAFPFGGDQRSSRSARGGRGPEGACRW